MNGSVNYSPAVAKVFEKPEWDSPKTKMLMAINRLDMDTYVKPPAEEIKKRRKKAKAARKQRRANAHK